MRASDADARMTDGSALRSVSGTVSAMAAAWGGRQDFFYLSKKDCPKKKIGASLSVRYGRCVGEQAHPQFTTQFTCFTCFTVTHVQTLTLQLWPLRGGAGTPPVYYSVYLLYLLYWYKRTNTDAAASRLGASSLKNSTKSLTVALLGLDNTPPTPAALRPSSSSSSSDGKDEGSLRPRTAKKASGSGRQVRNDGVVWKSY
jgi:hypothetical protein